jgi:hypothetical protein
MLFGKTAEKIVEGEVVTDGDTDDKPTINEQMLAVVDEITSEDNGDEDGDKPADGAAATDADDGSVEGKPAPEADGDKPGESDDDAEGDGEKAGAEAGKPAEGDETGAAAKKDGDAEGADDQYAVPEGLSDRASERFQTMVDGAKEKDGIIANQTEILTGFQTMLNDTGMSTEEFINIVSIAKQIKSGDASEAVKSLQDLTAQVARDRGVVPAAFEYDPLADYPDLKEKVEDQELTQDAAIELVRARKADEARRRTDDATEAESKYQGQRQTALNECANFFKEKEKDIDWETIAPHIQKASVHAAQTLPPEQWMSYIQDEYERIGEIIASARPSTNKDTRPLRSGSKPGGNKQPGSVEDVVNAVFDGEL